MWKKTVAIILQAALISRFEYVLASSSPRNIHNYGLKLSRSTSATALAKSSTFRSNYRGGSLTNPTSQIEPPDDITYYQSEADGSRVDTNESHDGSSATKSESEIEIDLESTQEVPKQSAPAKQHFSSRPEMDKRSILGRAVLTTPHRRMPAARIALGTRPSSSSSQSSEMVATQIFVTKFSLSESLGCALRDLRVIDQFAASGWYAGPAFLARKKCVVVNVGHVRAIVMRDQVLVFIPETSLGANGSSVASGGKGMGMDTLGLPGQMDQIDTIETIERLVEALVSHLNSIYHSSRRVYDVNSSTTEPNIVQSGSGADEGKGSPVWIGKRDTSSTHIDTNRKGGPRQKVAPYVEAAPPFELVVIEALLGHVCGFESFKVVELIKNAEYILTGIIDGINGKDPRKKDAFLQMQAKLAELLPLKNRVDELEARCSEVASAIAEVLKNDEDMAAMRLSKVQNLTSSDIPSSLHVEVELLFEDYLLQMDEVLHSLRTVQSSVRNTEEVVDIELDLLRNRIMRYEVLLELSGLVVGFAAAVTGAFGMNLINHFEDHGQMFYYVIGALTLIMGAMGFGFLRRLTTDNIF